MRELSLKMRALINVSMVKGTLEKSTPILQPILMKLEIFTPYPPK